MKLHTIGLPHLTLNFGISLLIFASSAVPSLARDKNSLENRSGSSIRGTSNGSLGGSIQRSSGGSTRTVTRLPARPQPKAASRVPNLTTSSNASPRNTVKIDPRPLTRSPSRVVHPDRHQSNTNSGGNPLRNIAAPPANRMVTPLPGETNGNRVTFPPIRGGTGGSNLGSLPAPPTGRIIAPLPGETNSGRITSPPNGRPNRPPEFNIDFSIGGGASGDSGILASEDSAAVEPEAEQLTTSEPSTEGTGDLELLGVRFVDAGNPREQLGPRYRIEVRNRTSSGVISPFNLTLLAANSSTPGAESLQTSERIKTIRAGETLKVDIRLPVDALGMDQDAAGRPLPFRTLFAMVDADDELVETNEENNLTIIERTKALLVDLNISNPGRTPAVAGAEFVIQGEGLGGKAGNVVIDLAGVKLNAEVLEWDFLSVRIRLPAVVIAKPVAARFTVVRADSTASEPQTLTIGTAK
jgi:hypothetical protein